MPKQTQVFDTRSDQVRRELLRHGCGIFIRGKCPGAEVLPSTRKPVAKLDHDLGVLVIRTGTVEFRVPSDPFYSLTDIRRAVRPLLR